MRPRGLATSLQLVCGALLAACAANAPAPDVDRSPVELFVLGIAQDGGLPHFGCERECCMAARGNGRTLWPACLGVVHHPSGQLLLVEATPRVEEQVALLHRLAGVEGRARQPVDAVLLTHAHIGHYLGLAHFGREVASTSEVRTYCSPRMAAFLSEHGPWKQLLALRQLSLLPQAARAPFSPIPSVTVTAIPVPHRDEFSDTMAFVIRGPSRAALFVPDIDAWERAPALLQELLDGVDVAYVDGTFFDGRELPERSLAEIPHPLMTDTMRRLEDRARAKPGSVRFLHCNHTNPVLHEAALVRSIEDRGFAVAQQGERIAL